MNKLQTITDSRGKLIPIDFNNFPFKPKRIFIVKDVPVGTERGGHAHKNCQQVLLCIEGEIKVDLYFKCNNNIEHHIKILKEGESLFHDTMEWATVIFMKPKSCLLSICSMEYNEKDYIRDWEDWKNL